jgi:phosphoribosylformimino-5-aminoimidazole carboxamide ribotide isomerase
MIIFPAIELLGGRCVSLCKGVYGKSSVVAADALETALSFKEKGAKWLHTVDLDGARGDYGANFAIIKELAQKSGLDIETGGGIRNIETAKRYIDAGVKRIIIGSAAVKNPSFVNECIKEFSAERVAVGIDADGGIVKTEGWTEKSGMRYIELALNMESRGVKYIIFTDISKDGTLAGANMNMLETLSRSVKCNIIASGGIKDIDDIIKIKELNLYGAICGLSLYKGTLDLRQAVKIAES